jgi:hypothetical protein
MSAFGVGQAEWHPYWRNEQLLRVQPESVKVSFYLRRAGGGQPGRALLVVSNLSAQAGQTAEVQLDPARLGLSAAAAAKDALRGEKLPLEQGRLSVPLPPMRMRLVRIE